MKPNPDLPSRLRTIADMLERGLVDRNVILGLAKILRQLVGASTDDTHLRIESTFGALSRKGVVRIEINNEWAILDPDEARKQAMYLLECAGSAEFDEFVYTDVAKKMELDDAGAGALLMAFREWRTKGEK